MNPELSEDVRALREAVGELKVTNATLTAAVQMLSDATAAAATIYARNDVIGPRVESVEKTLARHSSYWDWLIKLVVGAVILALLGLVISGAGA
jgi:hypothetical protein